MTSPIHSAHCATHRHREAPCDCPAGQLLAAAKDVDDVIWTIKLTHSELEVVRRFRLALVNCEAAPPAPEATKDKATLAGEERKGGDDLVCCDAFRNNREDVVYWNPSNRCVQCHACGHRWQPMPTQSGSNA